MNSIIEKEREFLRKTYGINSPLNSEVLRRGKKERFLEERRKEFYEKNADGRRYRSLKQVKGVSISSIQGKLHSGKLSKPVGKQQSIQVTTDDLDKGIISLINRGIVPPHLDFTEVINSFPAPCQSEKVPLEDYNKQFKKTIVQTELDDPEKGMATIKFDLFNHDDFKPRRPHRNNQGSKNLTYLSFGTTENVDKFYNPGALENQRKTQLSSRSDVSDASTVDEISEQAKQRSYNELMDEYSLHRILIRRGKTLVSTPEFISFQRTYQLQWGPIISILKMLENLFSHFSVPLAIVDGKKIVDLSENELRTPTLHELLNCIVNYENVVSHINLPQFKYKGKNGKDIAATTIQKTWKMYKTKQIFKQLKKKNNDILIIQNHWLRKKKYFATKELINEKFQAERKEWEKIMSEFKSNWESIKQERCFVLHLLSLSVKPQYCKTTPKFQVQEMSQLIRIMELRENVDILLITPYPIDEEAKDYMFKLLKLKGVKYPERRLKVIHPANFDAFPFYTSTTKCLLHSPETLRYIKTLALGRYTYIVPNFISEDEIRLAITLQIPLLGPQTEESLVYNTKSGNKRIFLKADVNVPPGSVDIYQSAELILQLSKKIIEHPEVENWMIKIDDEHHGRGRAILHLDNIKTLSEEGRKELIYELQQSRLESSFENILCDRLYFELRESLHQHVEILSPHIYPHWSAFVASFEENGGLFEAIPTEVVSNPTVNLFIAPNGIVTIESIQEQLIVNYLAQGVAFPQSNLPFQALKEASLSVAKVCYEKGIIGYVAVDYVSFLTESNALKLWGVDIKLQLTDFALMHRYFEFVTETKMTKNGVCLHPKTKKPLYYIYSGLLVDPQYSGHRNTNFFGRCRQKGLAYDQLELHGLLFHYIDSLLKGMFGGLVIGRTEDEVVSHFHKFVNFVMSHFNPEIHHLTAECNTNLVYKLANRMLQSVRKRQSGRVAAAGK